MNTKLILHTTITSILLLFICSCGQKSRWQIEEEQFNLKYDLKIKDIESENINYKIENQKIYFGFDSIHTIDLKDFLKKPRVFLYFSNSTCNPCIEQTVDIIHDIFPDYKQRDDIVFISPDYPARFRINCYGKKLLTLMKNELGLPIEKKDQPPFLFILGENLQIKSIHVVNKMDFNRTEEYLNSVKVCL